jgi:hypothetical protein
MGLSPSRDPIGRRRRLEYRGRRGYRMKRHRSSRLLFFPSSFMLLENPRQEIENTAAGEDAQPENELCAIDDHSLNINLGLKHWQINGINTKPCKLRERR